MKFGNLTLLVAAYITHVVADTKIVRADVHDIERLTPYFRNILEPLYGSQNRALSKMIVAEDRFTDIIIDTANNEIKGLLVYKNKPTNEFSIDNHEMTEQMEVKTFVLLNAAQDSGKGLGQMLFKHMIGCAKKMKADGIILTLSDAAPESAHRFFSKMKMFPIMRYESRYFDGVGETVMHAAIR